PPGPARPGADKKPEQAKGLLRHTDRKWEGGTYTTFDGWKIQELPNDLGGWLFRTYPPEREQDVSLLLFVATPPPARLARLVDLGPALVKFNYPHLERTGRSEECKFGGDEARLERYEGKRGGRKELAQAIFVRKKGVAVVVFGIGTEAGFKDFGRATEI